MATAAEPYKDRGPALGRSLSRIRSDRPTPLDVKFDAIIHTHLSLGRSILCVSGGDPRMKFLPASQKQHRPEGNLDWIKLEDSAWPFGPLTDNNWVPLGLESPRGPKRISVQDADFCRHEEEPTTCAEKRSSFRLPTGSFGTQWH